MQRHDNKVKLRPGAVDAIVTGIGPALIIGMICCLAFFLVVAFYQGEYDTRLMYLLGLYTMGTVLIARIAIESGRAYAGAFAFPLAVVAILAMWRFLDFSGSLGGLGWVVNIGLLGLIWYLADRITFDCTQVDERVVSSQMGLLQSLRLAKTDSAQTTSVRLEKPAKKKKRHNPGVWVFYFALLAVPLFGLGQLAIPETRGRSTAFYFLAGYMACALSLLVTTSFLGMRRYLRQKSILMPNEMVATWLSNGILGILLVVCACMLLPLPGRNFGLVEIPFVAQGKDGLKSNRLGWGNEGTDEGTPGGATTESDEGPASGPPQKDGQGPPAGGEGERDGQDGDGDGDQRAGGDSGSQSEDSPSDSGRQSDSQTAGQQDGKGSDPATGEPSDKPSERPADGQRATGDGAKQAESNQPQSEQDAASDSADNQSEPSGSSSSQSPSWNPLSKLGSSLQEIIKWLTIAALVLIIVVYALTHPQEILKIWRDLLQILSQLFGRGADRQPAASESQSAKPTYIPKKPQPFASYENPFSGAGDWPPQRIVEHSFAALESWAIEHGVTRPESQTPGEFAKQLRRHHPGVGQSAVQSAAMLEQLLFAQWQPSQADVKPLEKLWQQLSQ